MRPQPVLLRVPFDDWVCPNCGLTERTPALPPDSSRYHNCPRLHSLSAPLIRAGMSAKIEAVEREDVLGKQIQATGDDGKPYMAIRTEFADGVVNLNVNPGVARARMF
jgi:hypothetical protein